MTPKPLGSVRTARVLLLPILSMAILVVAARLSADSETPAGIEVPAPPFSEGAFPCSECHNPKDIRPNTTVRPLRDAHDEIVLNHGEKRWCLDCHDAEKRDSLRLVGGKLIGYRESYKLCGQCHGEKLRDWKAGIHGKRTGNWNGEKHYLLCVNCHDQHSPRFKPLKPLPAPVAPDEIR